MVPATVPRVANLQYLRALAPLDRAFEEQVARIAEHPCRPGCDACCYGPFDIGPADAWLLVEGLAALPRDVRYPTMERIADAASLHRVQVGAASGEPLSLDTLGEARFDEMCDALAGIACPLLDEAGRCRVYAFRPQPCRLVGARYRSDGDDLDYDCPIDLTSDTPAIGLDLAQIELAIARVEERLELPVLGGARTTIAVALDTILRNRPVTGVG